MHSTCNYHCHQGPHCGSHAAAESMQNAGISPGDYMLTEVDVKMIPEPKGVQDKEGGDQKENGKVCQHPLTPRIG